MKTKKKIKSLEELLIVESIPFKRTKSKSKLIQWAYSNYLSWTYKYYTGHKKKREELLMRDYTK